MTQVQFDQYQFDASDGTLRSLSNDAQTTLRPQLAKLLLCLLEQPDQVIDRQTLCAAIWGETAVVDFESGLAAALKELRHAFEQLGGSAAILETIPRRGYRLKVDAVRPLSDVKRARTRFMRFNWAELSGLVLITAALIWVVLPIGFSGSSGYQAHSLVILPFQRYDDLPNAPEHAEYLIADTLLARLWQAELNDLELIGRSSVQAYAQHDNVAAAVAEELRADLILEGDLIAGPDGWRVEARLLQLPGGRVIWSDTIHSAHDAPLNVDEAVAGFLASLQQQWPEILIKLRQRT